MITGADLREARQSAGYGLDRMSTLVGRSKSHLSRVERGHADRPVSPALVRDYETALRRKITAGSTPATTDHVPSPKGPGEEGDVYRRHLLGLLAGTALASDTVRTVLHHSLGGTAATLDDWDHIVAEYGRDYLFVPPAAIRDRLATDLLLLDRTFAATGAPRLHHVAAHLAVVHAMATASVGDALGASRWYRTAETFAAAHGDAALHAWVRGRRAFRRGYDLGDPELVIELTRDVPATEAGLARAQAYATLGSRANALAALHDAATSHIPGSATTIFGLDPWRMAIASALVHARLGDEPTTARTLDEIVAAHIPARWQAQADLTRLLSAAHAGDHTAGPRADAVVANLPPPQRSLTVRRLAEEVTCVMPKR